MTANSKTGVVSLLLLLCMAGSAFGQCNGHVVLNKYERAQFLSAAYSKQPDVAVQFLAAEGCGHILFDSVRRLGADVRFADQRAGYVLAVVPREKVLEALDMPGTAYALPALFDTSFRDPQYVPPSQRTPAPVPEVKIPYPRVATTLPQGGPYFAAAEAGLTELWQQHPGADGRGVRVAVFDSGFDLFHPALEMAEDGKGNSVPKVADIVTLTTPDQDPNWVQFGDPLHVTNGTFVSAGRTWTAPHDGIYRFGIFSKQLLLGTTQNPNATKLSLSVGVLWDEGSNRVWVDTDGDGSFRNQRALGDYAEAHDIDCFGQKEGDNDNRIPFGIKIDRERRAVYLAIPDGPHGGLIAGPLAANKLTGGLFDGAAPNAQLVDVRQPTRSSPNAFMAAILTAFSREDVDVINLSGGLGRPTQDGPQDFYRHIQERGAAVYDRPIVCQCAAAGALNINDYQSPEMLRRNRQLPPPYAETMYVASQTLDGMFITEVLTPSASLTVQSRFMPYDTLGEDGQRHTWRYGRAEPAPSAPAGYTIASNPSPTIPVAAGILADLVSEARQDHVRYSAGRLIQAVVTGTRLVKGFPLAKQGYGLINAAGAWDQLAKMATADDPKNSVLTSFTVSRNKVGPADEVGSFQADLPQAGVTLQSEIWITRRGGYPGARVYELSFRGNDEVYKLLDHRISFIRDQPARVRFEVRVVPGLHVALLQLKDVEAGVVMQEVPLTVRAPNVPEAIGPGVEGYQTKIPPRLAENLLVRVGHEVQAARFTMRVPYQGREVSMRAARMPDFYYGVVGGRLSASEPPSGEPLDAAHHVGPMEQFESLVSNSQPGTQFIEWDNRSLPEYETPSSDPAPDIPITATLTLTKYAVSFSKGAVQSVRMTNELSEIEGKVEFYDAKLASSYLMGTGSHAVATIDRTLPAGLSEWRVAVSVPTPEQGSTDAFLLSCNEKDGCSVVRQEPIVRGIAMLVVDEPKEGEWRIVIRTRDSNYKQSARYRVREAMVFPSASTTTGSGDSKFASGTSRSLLLPPRQADAQYVAFRIAGNIGKEQKSNEAARKGLRIAMTSLTPGAP